MKPAFTLVLLLVFMAIALTLTSAAIVIILVNSAAASKYEQSQMAYSLAAGGAQNALIRLLRDPAYAGETLTIPPLGTTIILVTGTNPKTIASTARVGNFKRQIQVTANDADGKLTVTNWTEQF